MFKSNEDCRNRQHCMNAGALAPQVAQFTRHLSELGHSRLTVSGYEAAARHIAQWLALTKVAVVEIDDAVIDRFGRHRCRCPGIRRVKGVSEKYVKRARRFVEFLSERGIVRSKPKSTSPAFDRHVIEFQEWLRQHRGITELTIGRHGRMVMRLLPALSRKPRSWDAQLIRDVILAETRRVSLAYVKTMTMALRGYLRFLGARGLCRAGLEQAVPTIPQWRLSALPRYIGIADVDRLIATCDRATPAGVRDRAILLLLARLGLRAGDILALAYITSIGSTRRSPFAARAVERPGFRSLRMRVTLYSTISSEAGPASPGRSYSSPRMLRSGRCADRRSRASFGVRWTVVASPPRRKEPISSGIRPPPPCCRAAPRSA
jgi:integrase/recombinase XerD